MRRLGLVGTVTWPRSRFRHLLAAGVVVALGLASRRWPDLLPARLGKYPGDALWALMVYCLWGAGLPMASAGRLTVLSLLTAYGVELSQLYQSPWIVGLRRSGLGHLVLGSAFDWRDLVAYTVGVLLAWASPWERERRHSASSTRQSVGDQPNAEGRE